MRTRDARRRRRRREPIPMHEIAGDAWRDWTIGADGLLYHPTWRRGFTGHELAALWFECQALAGLRHQVAQLTRDLADQGNQVDELQKENWWYRRQLSLEAKLGMMLERIAA